MHWCGQSSDDDDDKQQLLLDFFLSRWAIDWESFSSSFVAGKHKGGGGNFFDRDEKFAVDKLDSIWNELMFKFDGVFFLLFSTTTSQPDLREKEREKEKHHYEDKSSFSLHQNIDADVCV